MDSLKALRGSSVYPFLSSRMPNEAEIFQAVWHLAGQSIPAPGAVFPQQHLSWAFLARASPPVPAGLAVSAAQATSVFRYSFPSWRRVAMDFAAGHS